MEKVTLKQMTDFVLEITPLKTYEMKLGGVSEALHLINEYARFLKKNLELWMFVPCKLVDGVWVVLEKPDLTCKRPESKGNCQCGEELVKDCREWWNEYQEAKERVLFDGFVYNAAFNEASDGTIVCGKLRVIHNGGKIKGIVWGGLLNKIEDLAKHNLVLTESAKKQIGI